MSLDKPTAKFFNGICWIIYVNVVLMLTVGIFSVVSFEEWQLNLFILSSNLFLLLILSYNFEMRYRFDAHETKAPAQAGRKLLRLVQVICFILFVLIVSSGILFINAASVVSAKHFADAIVVTAFIHATVIGISVLLWVLGPIIKYPREEVEKARKRINAIWWGIVVLGILFMSS